MHELENVKLSRLLRVAIRCTNEISHDKRYNINYGAYHVPMAGVTHVCPAGCIMAVELGVGVNEQPRTLDFGKEMARRLQFVSNIVLAVSVDTALAIYEDAEDGKDYTVSSGLRGIDALETGALELERRGL